MLRWSITSISLLALWGCSSGVNLAERLGRPRDAKLLIIHADDLGTFHAVNRAYIQAQSAGLITSASINAPGRAFAEIAEHCRRHPELDVGVHTTLSSEFKKSPMGPVAPLDQVRSLVDEEGFFPPWLAKGAKPEEVAVELRAQIRKIIDAGIKPTHIDNHMGTAFGSYAMIRAYIDAAREFGLPAMALSPDARMVSGRIPKWFLLRGIGKMVYGYRVRGTPLLDELVADVEWDKEQRLSFRRDEFIKVIRNLKPGVTQIIIHPALDEPEMPTYDEWKWFTANRIQDGVIFSDPEIKRIIETEGVELIGWKAIRELLSPGRSSER